MNSQLIFNMKQSSEDRILEEANEIYVSRKNRQELLDQIINKVRWRFNNEKQLESNAKMVKWEDNSYGVYIGNDYYELDGESTGNEVLCAMQNQLMILQNKVIFNGKLNKRMKSIY